MNWLKRAGMILEFISFWLAAPEILGHDRLERLQHTSRSLPIRLSTPLSRAARASAVAIVVWTAMLSLKLFPRADAFPGDLASWGTGERAFVIWAGTYLEFYRHRAWVAATENSMSRSVRAVQNLLHDCEPLHHVSPGSEVLPCLP